MVQLDETLVDLQQATEQQIAILRMLRTQPRLLVEGCAGSGKTLLAVCLAREHAALGKSVLLTCFNRNLAEYLSDVLADVPTVTVMNFHELVRTRVLAAGLSFQVPEELQQRIKFFRDDCPELLINGVELLGEGFDTLIVDEGADFTSTWWVALEVLGRQDFSWYCFLIGSKPFIKMIMTGRLRLMLCLLCWIPILEIRDLLASKPLNGGK